jgi:tetratricopeptide (TPR) repeat protein
MKKSFLSLLVLSSLLDGDLLAQAPAEAPPSAPVTAPAAATAAPAAATAAPTLTREEKNQRCNTLLTEAQSLQTRKRFIDAFERLNEAEKLNPDNASIYNIRGAVYLAAQVRDADRARTEFKRALELQPDQLPPYFNLAETEFVVGSWAAAQKGFMLVLEKFPKTPVSIRHLILFKAMVCQAKLGQLPEVERAMADNFTFMDDSPAYYFAKAVVALERKNQTEGNDWLFKAQQIYKPAETSPYLDSMMETHYIDSLSVGQPEIKKATNP